MMPVGRQHLKRRGSVIQDTVYYLNQRPLYAAVPRARIRVSRNQGMEAVRAPLTITPNNSLTEILLFVLPTLSYAGVDFLVFKGECFHQQTQQWFYQTEMYDTTTHKFWTPYTTEPIALLHLCFCLFHTIILPDIPSLKFPISLHSSKLHSDHCAFTKPCNSSPAPRDLPLT